MALHSIGRRRPPTTSTTNLGQRLPTIVLAVFFGMACNDAPLFEGVATSSTGKNGASSLSIPVPASTTGSMSGDLLVAILGVKANPSTSGPSGWTAVSGFAGFNGAICASDGEGIACQLSVYYKIATGSETNASFSWGTNRQAAVAVLRYSRVDPGSPIGPADKQAGSSSSPTAPSITTTRDDTRILRIALTEADDVRTALTGSLVFGGEPATGRFNVVSFPDATTDPTNGCGPPLSGCSFTTDAVGLAASDARKSSAGASGTVSWSLPGSDQAVTASIAIQPPPSGGPVVISARE